MKLSQRGWPSLVASIMPSSMERRGSAMDSYHPHARRSCLVWISMVIFPPRPPAHNTVVELKEAPAPGALLFLVPADAPADLDLLGLPGKPGQVGRIPSRCFKNIRFHLSPLSKTQILLGCFLRFLVHDGTFSKGGTLANCCKRGSWLIAAFTTSQTALLAL
jgi:hypothetical protein